MSPSFHYLAVPVLTRSLANLKVVLEKAKAHAQEHKIDESVLVNARLYPDMFPLSRQVQVATDMARGGAARLSGAEPPSYEDTETTLGELIARVERTIEYMRGLDERAFDGAATRDIVRPVRGQPHKFTDLNYLLQYVTPNVYFHVATAYDILRHNGVKLGKADFLGALD
ncbi:MAG: DUF1993 domain-containing protein [Casimicrobiaceae bacterium]